MERNYFKITPVIGVNLGTLTQERNASQKTIYRKFLRDEYYNRACTVAEGVLDDLARGRIADAHRHGLRLNRILASLETFHEGV